MWHTSLDEGRAGRAVVRCSVKGAEPDVVGEDIQRPYKIHCACRAKRTEKRKKCESVSPRLLLLAPGSGRRHKASGERSGADPGRAAALRTSRQEERARTIAGSRNTSPETLGCLGCQRTLQVR